MTANKAGTSPEAIREWLDRLPDGIRKKLSSNELAILFTKMQTHKSTHLSSWIRDRWTTIPALFLQKTGKKQGKPSLVAHIQPRWGTFTGWAGDRVGQPLKALFLGLIAKAVRK
ncbi:MAG: hypothetical protein KDK37_15745 [Leptospiraceae bacterium]|nr:hypothetical protein [Leptospiraceae bacterium]